MGLAAALSSLPRAPLPSETLALEVARVPLDPRDAARERVGELVYRGGLVLRSADPRFGGFSDLRVSPNGTLLRAVSDCGRGFTATLSYDAHGRLSNLADPRLVDLVGPEGRALSAGQRDAESLIVNGQSLEVGFEGTDRILTYAGAPPFAGPARVVPTPARLRDCHSNGGIEAMALLSDERRFLVCEARRLPSQDVPAWLGRGPSWNERSYPLLFEGGWAGRPFRPSAAVSLPDGDVLVLERRFPPLGARIVRLDREALLGGKGPLRPREVARLESPLAVDNFEGIDVREQDGRTAVYVISDDNACAKNGGRARAPSPLRTTLLMFVFEP